jgi:hypothetical protein
VIFIAAVFLLRSPIQAADKAIVSSNTFDLKLTQVPDTPCLSMATVQGNPDKGPAVFVMKSVGVCKLPMHWHSFAESLVVVRGVKIEVPGQTPIRLRDGGFFYAPPHKVGGAVFAPNTLFFVSFDGGPLDTHYVDDTGKEISSKEAYNRLKHTQM